VETSTSELDSHPSVLVVDDERGPRLALQLVLQREFRVLTAESGEEALEILRSEPVDAVTLDLKMPGLAGQNTLSLIRGLDPALPVVIITGYGSYESAINALKLRAFDYVSKPFDSRKILTVVSQAVLARRRATAQDPAAFIAPLDAVIEAAEWLERSGSEWLSNPDRAALECIRANARAVQEQCRSNAPSDEGTYELFDSRKGHG
jgi:DNA-binding response OmpR family regulator